MTMTDQPCASDPTFECMGRADNHVRREDRYETITDTSPADPHEVLQRLKGDALYHRIYDVQMPCSNFICL
jgi:hypothetical protein